ncbi:hypothetical protein RB195_021004 [Necator americanus]|uniref:Uncharacterized protein n=1 Tax=Necator americanus TaxID=51031 RepID=A0ABR1CLP5_NECAM
MSKRPSQEVVIVGIDADVKIGLELRSGVLGKCYYSTERTLDYRAPSTVMERLDCTEKKVSGYFWPGVATENRLRFLGYIIRRPADHLVQRVLMSLSGSNWKRPPGQKRKFWAGVVEKDLGTLGVYKLCRQDVKFRIICDIDEWIDFVQAPAEDREG